MSPAGDLPKVGIPIAIPTLTVDRGASASGAAAILDPIAQLFGKLERVFCSETK